MTSTPEPDRYLGDVLADARPGHWDRLLDTPTTQWQKWWVTVANDADRVVSRAAERGFVLDAADLDAVGVSRQRARTLVGRATWTDAGHGFVAPMSLSDPRRIHVATSAALTRRRPRDVLSGRSAAILCGLPTMRVPPAVESTIRSRPVALGRSSTGHRFGAALTTAETTTWFGVPVTTVGRTLVDLARHDRFDAIMAVDAALRSGLISADGVATSLSSAAGWPGVRQARDVLRLGTPRAESPLESLTRLRLHDDGFPPPQLQWPIAGYEVDFCWPELRFVLEADGRIKYSADALWAEKRRELVLRRNGYRVERVVWRHVVTGWADTSAGLRPPLCLPRADG